MSQPNPDVFDVLPTSEQMAETLLVSFRWAETPQGHEYWEKKYWHLVSAQSPVIPAPSIETDLMMTKQQPSQRQAGSFGG
ncbi:MAG TPA: hypothetical protein VLJ86_06515 [Ramlibacter sp.]|nr:hypothetical protein [Ramlibacter sp.]